MPAAVRILLGSAFLAVVMATGGPASAEPQRRGWDDLTPAERDEVWRTYQEYQRLPKDRQQFLERRYDRYREMPQAERRRLRRNYDRYRELEPSERQRFLEGYREWKSRSKARKGGESERPARRQKAR